MFLFFSETVPHGGHDLGDVSKGGVGVLAFNSSLSIPEEQRVRRHGLLRLVRILLLLLLLRFGFGLHHVRGRPLLARELKGKRERESRFAYYRKKTDNASVYIHTFFSICVKYKYIFRFFFKSVVSQNALLF